MTRPSFVILANLVLVTSACESGGGAAGAPAGELDRSGAGAQPEARPDEAPAAAPEDEAEEYTVDGTVKSVEAVEHRITIAHDDVPGYMPAMTMPFYAEDASMLAGLAEGDSVRFRFRKPSSGHRHDLVSIEKRAE